MWVVQSIVETFVKCMCLTVVPHSLQLLLPSPLHPPIARHRTYTLNRLLCAAAKFMSFCIVNGDQAGRRALSSDVSASLAMVICHHHILFIVTVSTMSTRVVQKMTFADRYLHVYIETSENRSIGGGKGWDGGLVPSGAGEVHLSLYYLRPQGGMHALALLFLFFLAGVATPASANRKQFRELVHQCCHLFCFPLGGGN